MSERPLVVAFANADYVGVLANWLLGFKRLGLPLPQIFALDEQTRDWAEAWGCPTELIPWDGDLAVLWAERARVFAQLAEAGTDFVHSDIDAMWLRDPLADPELEAPGADMAFSQGTVWPRDVHARQGFVLCCGWFRIRPTDPSRRFLRALAEDVARTGDDQISVNRLLEGAVWRPAGARRYSLARQADLFSCWQSTIYGEHEGFGARLALLPHGRIQRVRDHWPDPAVQHFLTPKTAREKLDMFARCGLLHLKAPETPRKWAPLEALAAEPA